MVTDPITGWFPLGFEKSICQECGIVRLVSREFLHAALQEQIKTHNAGIPDQSFCFLCVDKLDNFE